MPVLTAKEAYALKDKLNVPLVRVPQYRQIIDQRMTTLDAFKNVLAPDYQAAFVPAQTGSPNKALFRLTNIMAANPHEFSAVVRSTDQSEVNLGQDYEDAHVAIDELIFTTETKRKLRGFLGDSYGVVAVDIKPSREVLAKYADREGLEAYAEGDDEEDDEPEDRFCECCETVLATDEKEVCGPCAEICAADDAAHAKEDDLKNILKTTNDAQRDPRQVDGADRR